MKIHMKIQQKQLLNLQIKKKKKIMKTKLKKIQFPYTIQMQIAEN